MSNAKDDLIAHVERGIDARTAFKKYAKGGGRPVTIRREQEVERFDAQPQA